MSNGTKVKKRDGRIESLDLDKMHLMVEEACKGLAGVSASQVEMTSGIQFYDGISTGEVQEILIKSAADLIDLENPNYQFVAARLLLFSVRKSLYGKIKEHPTFFEHINKCVDMQVYDKEILSNYTEEELLFETKFEIRAKSTDQVINSSSALGSKYISYPAIFIRMESANGEDFALGGLDKMISNFRCLVLADNTFSLDAVCSILKDLRKTEFSIIDPSVLPYSNFGAITGSGYNYNTQVNNQTEKSLIWDVSVSKIAFSDNRIKLTNPQVCSAIVDFEVYSFRNPRA